MIILTRTTPMEKKVKSALLKHIVGKTVNHIIKHSCGKKLGRGYNRTVYELKDFPEYVIKFERDMTSGNFANVTEWRNYINNESWKQFGSWLAPCHLINEYGNVLIQSKVEHRDHKEYPKKIPSLFTDTKYHNFGWIGDRFVCCDYSFLLACDFKLKRAKWWNP